MIEYNDKADNILALINARSTKHKSPDSILTSIKARSTTNKIPDTIPVNKPESSDNKTMKLTVIYDPIYGDVVGDDQVFEAIERVVGLAEPKDRTIIISNELLVMALRVMIKRGNIDPNDVVLMYNDVEYTFDKNGKFNDNKAYPLTMWDRLLDELLE